MADNAAHTQKGNCFKETSLKSYKKNSCMFYHMSDNTNFEIAKTSHCLLQTLDAVTV